jgi:hypothetical protein
MADYIPSSDTDFLAWLNKFNDYAGDNLLSLGLVAADLTPITTAINDFRNAIDINVSTQNDARSARIYKDGKRDTVETAVRALVRRLQASPNVDDSERASLGITVKDTIRTMNAATDAMRPVAMVDTSQRLRHEIRFVDEANPTSRAKPKGVMGCELWVRISPQGEPAPTDPAQLSFLAMDTASPYVADYDGANAGKVAHYMLRWAMTGGQKGPWSETASATIVG